MSFKNFVGVLYRSLIRNLFTTPGVYRKLDVRATTKRTLLVPFCEIPSMAGRLLGNNPDDQLSHCTLTENGHKLNELSHCIGWPASETTHCGHATPTELSHCTLTHCGYKPSEPSQCTDWPNR